MYCVQNARCTSPVLPMSPQTEFDLALTLLREQLQPQQPMTSRRGDVTRSPTESLLLAALGLAVPAAATDAAGDGATSTAAEGPWTPAGMSAAALRRYKTELCRAYEERGQCRYGDRCQFAHGAGELRATQRHPKYKTELCRTYHTSGYCPYGARCHFVHNGRTPPAPPPTPLDLDPRQSDVGCAVPDNIQLSLLSVALENQASSTANTTRTAVNIVSLSLVLFAVTYV